MFMKFIVYSISLFAAALGTILSSFLIDANIINLPELIVAIIWFLISFVTYISAKNLKDEKWFKLISIDFFLTWAFTTIGVLIGVLVWTLIDFGSVSIDFDAMMNLFFFTLPFSLGPTATTSMGLRD